MKKLVFGLMLAAALAFVSYSAYAHCGKCGHEGAGCKTQSSQPACKSVDGKPGCNTHKSCGCCEKCGKGECKMMSGGEPCCEKCAKGDCCKMSCKGCGCCDKRGKGECGMKGGKCCDKCECACCAKKGACKSGQAAGAAHDFAPDPVCGMDVDTKDAMIKYEHEGKTYFFCSETCKDRFSKDPSKFLGD